MEVMSSLLLCALVALLPQSLVTGKQITDTIYNNSLMIQQKNSNHKLLLNLNGSPLVPRVSELQSVFGDNVCKNCLDCMERAIKAHKVTKYYKEMKQIATDLHNDVLAAGVKMRAKRAVGSNQNAQRNEKRNKHKNRKVSKITTATKYIVDGVVQALKVKESNGENGDTCEVFSVIKSYPCDTPEGDALLAAAKRRTKRMKTSTVPTTSGTKLSKLTTTSVYRKRQVDNSQVPENVMTSVEEYY